MTTTKPFDPKSTKTMTWYVLCVTPHKELEIADILKSIGIEVFCPTSNDIEHSNESKKTISKPLFPSYIFVKISKRNRVAVFNVSGITRYLFCEGRPAQVRESEIDTMKSWIDDDSVHEIVISKYSTNTTTVIKDHLYKYRRAAINGVKKGSPKLILKSLDVVLYTKAKDLVRNRKSYDYFYAN